MILTEAQRLRQDSPKRFAEAEIHPHVREWERDGRVPREVLPKMGQLGLMGMVVPQALGGLGPDFVSYVLATEEIAAADCGLCNMMNVNNSPIGVAIRDHGRHLQQETFLRPLALRICCASGFEEQLDICRRHVGNTLSLSVCSQPRAAHSTLLR